MTYGNRWEVMESLDEGGQAHTFLVRDLANPNSEPSVLKRLKNPKRLGRFATEVKAIQKIGHLNVLSIQDFNLTDAPAYFVTEYCAGGTLREQCERQGPTLAEAFRTFIQVADAVNHAHSQGVIHRDLKPDNIFIRLPGGDAVVGDFGLCFLNGSNERHTETQEVVGSRFFLAPEMEDGRADDVTPSADVYSLGKLLYWLVSGGKVFNREKVRHPDFDLTLIEPHQFKKGANMEMEHISRLLEHMIVADPIKRAVLSDVILSTKRIATLIARGINPVSSIHPQTCTYCGWGTYREVASGNGASISNFGLANVGNPNWRIAACDECGHVQIFRIDLARRDSWWEKQQ